MRSIIIPARGGSKSIAQKNLQSINGETLIGRCVQTCAKAGVGPVIVSTDDETIALEAARYGGDVHWRSEENSRDESDSQSVLVEVRDALKLHGTMAFVQCTAPLLTPNDIVDCIENVETTDADLSLIGYPFHGFVMSRSDYGWNCVNRNMFPVPRRQDLPTQYVISGSCWAFDATYLNQRFYSGRVNVVEAEDTRHIDIDTQSDLDNARRLIGNGHFVASYTFSDLG